MRLPFVAAIAVCLAMPATSQDDPFLSGEALQKKIQQCGDGCVVFTREDAVKFESQLELILSRRMVEAFQAGVQHQRQACASLI